MNEISKQLLMFIPYMKLYFMFEPTLMLSPVSSKEPGNHLFKVVCLLHYKPNLNMMAQRLPVTYPRALMMEQESKTASRHREEYHLDC